MLLSNIKRAKKSASAGPQIGQKRKAEFEANHQGVRSKGEGGALQSAEANHGNLHEDIVYGDCKLIQKQGNTVAVQTLRVIQRKPVTFYSQWRLRDIERQLLKFLKRVQHKLDSGAGNAPYQHFPLQEPAIQFARNHDLASELRVFSWEKDSTGKRSFIVTSYEEFWRQYQEAIPSHRHYYEIILQGWPCHLYFDLEFSKVHNPDVDGQSLVDQVILQTSKKMKERFGILVGEDCILELDSSNDVKFSRHLIVLAPDSCFRSNAHIGAFVEDLVFANDAPAAGYNPELSHFYLNKDDTGKKTCFIDSSVYTKNRAFRLMLSSKAGKETVLQPTGRLRPLTNLKASFMESLICNVPQTARLLTCFEGDPPLPPSRIPVHETSDTASTSAAQFGPCPLPSVAAFITEVLSQLGVGGKIRSWVWWHQSNLLLLNIAGNRYCANIDRQHKSNGVYYVVDMQDGIWFQRCYDPDCRTFRSEIMPLPPDVWQEGCEEVKLLERAQEADHKIMARDRATEAEGVLVDDGWPDDSIALQELMKIEASIFQT